MGWLSAIGQGGQQGLDRYSQWRQLDQENQWKVKDRQRQAGLDADNKREGDIRLKALYAALMKEQLGDTTQQLAPGDVADEATYAKALEFGGDNMFGPDRIYRGTYDQRQKADETKQRKQMFDFDVTAKQGAAADDARARAAQAQVDQFVKANPKATSDQMFAAYERAGGDKLPPALELQIRQKQQIELARITADRYGAQAAAQVMAAEKRAEAAAKLARENDARDAARAIPNTFGKLLASRQAQLASKGEELGDAQRGAAALEWGQIRPQLSALEKQGGMPISNQPYMQGGSPEYQNMVQQIPSVVRDIVMGKTTVDEAMQDIHSSQLGGAEMQALRTQLREYLGPLGIDDVTFTGNEGQTFIGPAAPRPGQRTPLANAISNRGSLQ